MFIIYRSTSGDRTDFTKNVLTDLDGALISPEWYDGENSDSVLIHRGFDTEYARFRNTILNIAARTESKKVLTESKMKELTNGTVLRLKTKRGNYLSMNEMEKKLLLVLTLIKILISMLND